MAPDPRMQRARFHAPRTACLLWGLLATTGPVPGARADAQNGEGIQPSAEEDAHARLASARARHKQGDHTGAAALALEVLQAHPGNGSAYLVLGMARFGAARYEEALTAFDTARQSEDPPFPGLLSFNQASALFALGRFAEAERAFASAADAYAVGDDKRLAIVASVNAAHSALGRGDPVAARSHHARAQGLDGDATMHESVSELATTIDDAEERLLYQHLDAVRARGRKALQDGRPSDAASIYQAGLAQAVAHQAPAEEQADLAFGLGLALYRGGKHDQAGPHLQRAAELDPSDPELRYMVGLNHYRADRPGEAKRAFDAALSAKLPDDTAQLARGYRDALGFGLASQGEGLQARVTAGTGYDTNVTQLGILRTEVVVGEAPESTGGPLATVSADASVGFRLAPDLFLQASYLLDQLAYTADEHDLFSLQSHSLDTRIEQTVGVLHLGLGATGDVQFSGVSSYEAFQRALSIEPNLGIDEGDRTFTWFRLKYQDKKTFSDQLSYFAGRRIDASVEQVLRFSPFRARLTLRHRRENIGTRTVDLGILRAGTNITGLYYFPFSYRSNGASLFASVRVTDELRLGASTSYESVNYTEDSTVFATGSGLNQRQITREIARVRRQDDRYGVGFEISYTLGDYFDLTARYDLLVNDSTMNLAFDDKNYSKHLFAVELGFDY